MRIGRKLWGVLILAVMALTVAACAQVGAPPTTMAAGEEAPARGGGGEIPPTGQLIEGLVVVGSGTASAEPEVALITLGVELRGDGPADIVDEASQRINRVIAVAQQEEVAKEDIRTAGYSLWVENVYDPERGTPTGEVVYHVSHSVQVTQRDLDKLGDMLAAAVEAGANTISGVSFRVEDPKALVEQARQEALQDAADRAKQMAEGLGVTLGKPIAVMETGGGYPMPVGYGGGGGGGMAEMAAPSISPGAFSVSVSIQVVYEIR
jgi:uncharacterized protein YggE